MTNIETAELLAEAAALAKRRQPYALATVVWRRPPSSVKAGAKALVTPDGLIRGWIGGGCSEPVVKREALRALEEGTPRLLHLTPPDELPSPRQGIVVAPMTCASEGALVVFVEPYLPKPQLAIIGDAPTAHTLAELAGVLEFEVATIDPFDPTDIGPDLDMAGVAGSSFIVVATMDSYDETALEAALSTQAPYIALVASRKRAESVFETLRRSGVGSEQLRRGRAPAGLDLGPLPHHEIAVAILAEIVQLKAAGPSGPRAATGTEEGVPEEEPSAIPEEPAAVSFQPDVIPEVIEDVRAFAPTDEEAGFTVTQREAVDPVCGMTVDVEMARFIVRNNGRSYFFCSDRCRRQFEDEPAKYAVGRGRA